MLSTDPRLHMIEGVSKTSRQGRVSLCSITHVDMTHETHAGVSYSAALASKLLRRMQTPDVNRNDRFSAKMNPTCLFHPLQTWLISYLMSSHVVLCWEEEKLGNRMCTCVCSVLIKPDFCLQMSHWNQSDLFRLPLQLVTARTLGLKASVTAKELALWFTLSENRSPDHSCFISFCKTFLWWNN